MEEDLKILHKGLMLLAALAIVACSGASSSGGGGGSPGGGGGGGVDSEYSQSISALPELRAALPASLDKNNSSGTTASMRGSVVTADSLNHVKSQGWFDIQSAADPDETTKMFLDVLKAYAAENEIQQNVAFSLGEHTYTMYGESQTMDFGKALVIGEEEDFTVYWYVGDEGMPLYMIIDVQESGENTSVELQAEMSFVEEGFSLNMNVYTKFDEATGENVLAIKSDDATGMMPSYVTISEELDDGSFLVMDKDSSYAKIGWGNDSYGGLISKFDDSGMDFGEGDFPGGEEAVPGEGEFDEPMPAAAMAESMGGSYVSREFYDANGNLVLMEYGETERDTYILDMYSDEVAFNINNLPLGAGGVAPENFYLKMTFGPNPEDNTTSWSTNGTDYSEFSLPESAFEFVFKAGTDWVNGDCVYYCENFEENGEGDGVTVKFIKGFQLTDGESILGESFYMTKQYPLIRLLPLASGYSDYNLVKESQGTETFTFTDWDEEEVTVTFENFQYFLDNNTDDAGNETLDEENDRDILIDGIAPQEVFYYNPSTDELTADKTAFFTTTSGLPAMFSFSEDNQSLVDTVSARLNTLITERLDALDVSDYDDKLVSIKDNAYFSELTE